MTPVLRLDEQNAFMPVRLLFQESTVIVERERIRKIREILFFLCLFGVASIVSSLALFTAGLMLWIAVTEIDILAFAVSLLFGLLSLYLSVRWMLLQGIFFQYRVTVAEGRYTIANGLFRRSLHIDPASSEIVIHCLYKKGDWGYYAKLKSPGRWGGLQFIPNGMYGTKHDAAMEALRVRDWLKEYLPQCSVTMSRWGNIENIQRDPDEDCA